MIGASNEGCTSLLFCDAECVILRPQIRLQTVAKLYGILPETLHCRTTGPLKGFYGHLSGGTGVPRIFTCDEENELVGHITKFVQAGFPFTPN